MLSISVERNATAALLHCVGRIVVGEPLSALKEAVLCQLDKRAIILDLSGIDAIDAGGLGQLVFLHICANGLGTELQLMAPSPAVSQVLSLTRLISVFTICPAAGTGDGLAPFSVDRSWEACA